MRPKPTHVLPLLTLFLITLPLLATLAVVGCTLNLDLGAETLFPEGSAFVLSGTADTIDTDDGRCNVWLGENGVTYHLFQSPQIDNGDFDQITTPGVTSRLEVATRNDLIVSCQVGTIVTVEDVLEIVP